MAKFPVRFSLERGLVLSGAGEDQGFRSALEDSASLEEVDSVSGRPKERHWARSARSVRTSTFGPRYVARKWGSVWKEPPALASARPARLAIFPPGRHRSMVRWLNGCAWV